MFGDAINLAARLMGVASRNGHAVLCDSRTREMARGTAEFVALEPMLVKGKKFPVDVFKVLPAGPAAAPTPTMAANSSFTTSTFGEHTPAAAAEVVDGGSPTSLLQGPNEQAPIIGREEVIGPIQGRIRALLAGEDSSGGIILLEGEAGIGKSRVIAALLAAGLPGVSSTHLLFGRAEAATKSQVLHPWRGAIQTLCRHDVAESTSAPTSRWGARCRERISDVEVGLPLVASALGLPLFDLPIMPQRSRSSTGSLDAMQQLAPHEQPLPSPQGSRLSTLGCALSAQQSSRGSSPGSVASAVASLPPTVKVPSFNRKRSTSDFAMVSISATASSLPLSPFSAASHWPPWSGDGDTNRPPTGSDAASTAPLPQSARSAWRHGSSSGASVPLARSASAVPTATPAEPRKRRPPGRAATSRFLAHSTVTARGIAMSHALKAQRVQELLVAMLQEFVVLYGRIVVLFEDLQHFDSASCRLLSALIAALPSDLLVVAAYRPAGNHAATAENEFQHGSGTGSGPASGFPAVLQGLAGAPTTTRICLQPFTAQETAALVAHTFDGTAAPAAFLAQAAAAIHERSCGLPLFIQEMAVHLRQAVTGSSGGRVRGSLGALLEASAAVVRSSASVAAVITARIDRLPPSQQLTLKVAAAVGMRLPLDLLVAVHPLVDTTAALQGDLHSLAAAQFLRLDPDDGIWAWTQALAREVAYELIPFSQRRRLHAAVAEAQEAALKRGDAGPEAPTAANIAYNYSAACATVEVTEWRHALLAADWWERAANEALERGAQLEALHLLGRAATLAEALHDYEQEANKVWVWLMDRRTGSQDGSGNPRAEAHLARLSAAPLATAAATAQDGASGAAVRRNVARERRVAWERTMAELALQLGDLQGAICHALQALHLLGCPLPGQERRRRRWHGVALCCCMAPASAQDVHDNSDDSDNGSSAPTPQGLPTLGSRQQLTEAEATEAATVLDMLLQNSAQAGDADALRYVQSTANLLGGGRLASGTAVPGAALLRDVWRRSGAALRSRKGRSKCEGASATQTAMDIAASSQNVLQEMLAT